MAHFEVYILNYNGMRYLPDCLDALARVRLGPHQMQVNVVDNASQDGSWEFIEEHFPDVNYIALDQNYGFSAGNNLGVEARIEALAAEGTRADVHVLLNNDTRVDPDWLCAAWEVFEENERAGIVGSKAVFADHFVPLSISCDNSYIPADYGFPDERKHSALLHYGFTGVNVVNGPGRVKYKNVYAGLGRGCVLEADAEVYVPVRDEAQDAWFGLFFENHHPERRPLSLRVQIGRQSPAQHVEIPAGPVTPTYLSATPADYCEYIQNAGSFIRSDCYAGDRGFLVANGEDYNEVERVAAICGVSMFVRDEVWKALGGFDETFFAYYEDTDLSIRAQQLGWDCVYTPHSTLKHVHCGSGVEFSEYFLKNVAWSHLVFASKTMPQEQWRAKLREAKGHARSEFRAFEKDFELANKPNLQAYCRYLRAYPSFLKNRYRAQQTPLHSLLGELLQEPSA